MRGDRSRTIREAFIDMQRTMAITLLLVATYLLSLVALGNTEAEYVKVLYKRRWPALPRLKW